MRIQLMKWHIILVKAALGAAIILISPGVPSTAAQASMISAHDPLSPLKPTPAIIYVKSGFSSNNPFAGGSLLTPIGEGTVQDRDVQEGAAIADIHLDVTKVRLRLR